MSNSLAVLSIFEVISWILYVVILFCEHKNWESYAILSTIVINYILNCYFLFYIRSKIQNFDSVYASWKLKNKLGSKLIEILSILISLKAYRLIFGHLFNK